MFKENEENTRVEAMSKVTGAAKYAAEYTVNNICYGVLVGSTIAAGKIKHINTQFALQVSGVLGIISNENKVVIPAFSTPEKIKKSNYPFPIFHTDKIYYKGQHIALVIAETLEEAQFAASLIEVEYDKEDFNVDFFATQKTVELKKNEKERGSLKDWENTPIFVESDYTIQAEVHHPMEPHATIAAWISTDKVRLYDKNQGVNNVQRVIGNLFEIKSENVEVISEFVGGGFGAGLLVWPHTIAAVMASKQINRPIKIVLTRQQMFTCVGFRPASWQKIKLGADNTGKFLGLLHQHKNECSLLQNFSDGMGRISKICYAIPNLKIENAEVPLNISMPTWMRGPGECSGAFALESAIDELSYTINMDPIELRLKNISYNKHPDNNLPWSTHFVKECIEIGAEKINWKNRRPQPKQHIQQNEYIGYGMAVGMWGAGRTTASASISINKNGEIIVKSAITDIGTGTGTGMQNVTNLITGMPKSNIKIQLGNSNLPPAPSQGGSIGLSSIVGAVEAACTNIMNKLLSFAIIINPNFKDLKNTDIYLTLEGLVNKNNRLDFISFKEIFEKQQIEIIEEKASSGVGEERKKFAFCVSAAHFCKVKINGLTGKIKIDQFVSIVDGGKIINPTAASNQVSGAVIGGIGMALMEEKILDNKLGGIIGEDFVNYHFPVNSDAPIVEVHFINKPDFNSNPIGSKGIGEVGIIGSAAAISNAIYNAIGIRCRDLPILPEKLIVQ